MSRLTIDIRLTLHRLHIFRNPATAAPIILSHLQASCKRSEDQRQHLRVLVGITFGVGEEACDFLFGNLIRRMRERARLPSSLKRLKYIEQLGLWRQAADELARYVITRARPEGEERVDRAVEHIHVLGLGHGMRE